MMQDADASLRNISDTALWVAAYRARETDRPDALFRDPFAARLAGRRGADIAARLSPDHKQEWAFTTRTYLYDQLISAQVAAGADAVLNLAAGLDARPYRMDLPSDLKWIEVDLAPIIDYKESVLVDDEPRCQLERVALDLSNGGQRRDLFHRIASSAQRVLVVTEGLVIYLPRDAVAQLARDLAEPVAFDSWVVDIVSPGLLRMMVRQRGKELSAANAAFQFAPEEGEAFYEAHGWQVNEVRSVFKTARRLRRLPFFLNLLAMLPEPKRPKPNAVWSRICLLSRWPAA